MKTQNETAQPSKSASTPQKKLDEINISYFRDAISTEPQDVPISQVIREIRDGGLKSRPLVEEIRQARQRGDKDKASELKRRLPAVTLSGTFAERKNSGLIQHSGFLGADLDSLNGELENVRTKLRQSPYIFALCMSSSGHGLRAVFRVPADPAKHAGSFRAVERHVRELTGKQIDPACKDLVRLCFMSYDPDIYINENAIEIEPLPEPARPKPISNHVINARARQRVATELLEGVEWESETSGFVSCPGKHLHTNGNGVRDCKIDLDAVPTVHCFHSSCRGVLDGVNNELRSRIGRAEYVPPIKPTGEDSSYRSSLQTESDFPHTVSEYALHGLAGDIVRRIEPHTESDRVAILVQVLTAFGSAIGRTAFASVEGARHFGNLFLVLVGESSKARKGTSWNHVLRLFERADEQWRKNCIANGLASGEGLIWSVRDAIEESKPVKENGKYTGEYEVVTTDQGVSEKRLCVQEGEFANVLKVMAREGNTLSPVIRSAWDTGYLRSLTKNFPAKATEAHISIIGHITRDELRRLLTETESANGFANRFLWAAVRRSRCLPEGGNINQEDFDEIVRALSQAIEFAKAQTEVIRNAAAKDFWAKIYPELSEGKPGLLGSITARSEAQVLRLSVLYALLDCSPVVRVEHLRASLAMWSYCERSAHWIFGTATGDGNADRILAALRKAGEAGLTRTEILKDVCERNFPADQLGDLLRLLERQGAAWSQSEKTATKPRERWFSEPASYDLYDLSTSVASEQPETAANKSYKSCVSDENAEQQPCIVGDRKPLTSGEFLAEATRLFNGKPAKEEKHQ